LPLAGFQDHYKSLFCNATNFNSLIFSHIR